MRHTFVLTLKSIMAAPPPSDSRRYCPRAAINCSPLTTTTTAWSIFTSGSALIYRPLISAVMAGWRPRSHKNRDDEANGREGEAAVQKAWAPVGFHGLGFGRDTLRSGKSGFQSASAHLRSLVDGRGGTWKQPTNVQIHRCWGKVTKTTISHATRYSSPATWGSITTWIWNEWICEKQMGTICNL